MEYGSDDDHDEMGAMPVTGATAILNAAVAAGLEVCFANPGTTELHLVEALDRTPKIRPILGLFEGVCTGAADGYARMSGVPALTMLHLGPGLSNGLAPIHNARRAMTPMVNIVGDFPTWHRSADAPLASDIEALARTSSKWVRTVESASRAATDCIDAISASTSPAPAPVTLIVPEDCATESTTQTIPPLPAKRRIEIDPDVVSEVARVLSRHREGCTVLVGGDALEKESKRLIAQIAARTGCSVFTYFPSSREHAGRDTPSFPVLPHFADQAFAALKGASAVVLVGANEPVSFFGVDGVPARLVSPPAEIITLVAAGFPAFESVATLADTLDVGGEMTPDRYRPDRGGAPPEAQLTPRSLVHTIAQVLPEGCVVIHEAGTLGPLLVSASRSAAPHVRMFTTGGGAIGQGLPCAVGAAIACPGAKVVSVQADGSAAYTAQALWTMARELLDITIVLCANRRYAILQAELERANLRLARESTQRLLSLDMPSIDWSAVSAGYGVPSVTVRDVDQLRSELLAGISTTGPRLVEAVLE